ncbi:hypothetical protein ACJRO7_019299 [Eucalyptus globulus]|uniref:Xyloglucan endotransglucosylase/hydrolase n=1 Tax=Eucalyptus globulus TaxID=34317 RepID=A0ABD3KCK8_EUCGL
MDPLRRLVSLAVTTSSSSSSLSSLTLLLALLFYAASAAAAFDIVPITFDEAYAPLFGDSNVVRSGDGKSVRLLLDRFSGSGFISSNLYKYGFFSARIKLPSDYTAGIVVAFYTSNGDVFEKTHDELDIEFLGNIKGKKWRFQTNVYGNGSTSRGREERYTLWFDPTRAFHRYSILWTANNIIFYVDEVPIREIIRNDAMGGDFPAKPMALYATIWDASDWATSGGRYKVNYKYAPFVAEFKDLVLQGCPVDPIDQYSSGHCYDKLALLEAQDFATVTAQRHAAMRRFRQNYMYYSYCYDSIRYAIPPPECVILQSEKERFKDTGRLKFGGSHKKRSRRRGHRIPLVSEEQPVM